MSMSCSARTEPKVTLTAAQLHGRLIAVVICRPRAERLHADVVVDQYRQQDDECRGRP